MERRSLSRRGFSLAELVFSILILTLIILTMIGLVTSTVRTEEKAKLLGRAGGVLESIIQQTIYQVDNDSPAGTSTSFWGSSGVWSSGSVVRGEVTYTFEVSTADVAGFGTPGNRMKKMDVTLWWWNSESSGGARQGYGQMKLQGSRVVTEIGP